MQFKLTQQELYVTWNTLKSLSLVARQDRNRDMSRYLERLTNKFTKNAHTVNLSGGEAEFVKNIMGAMKDKFNEHDELNPHNETIESLIQTLG